MSLALGLDVGGTKILACVSDAEGRVVARCRLDTPARAGAGAVLDALVAGAREAMGGLSVEDHRALVAVGVSAAGQIDVDNGVVAYASPNISGWTGTPVGPHLQAALGVPVFVENDANAAAFGEWACGAGRGAPSIVAITVGTGVGGGLILNHSIWRGRHWRGAEIGHMVLFGDGVRCNCGQTGCLEAYVSGTAIARLARETRPGFSGDARAVFAAAERGDVAMQEVLAFSARCLAQGLVSLSSLVDVDLYLLGGGVATRPGYLDLVRRALKDPQVSGERGFAPELLQEAALGEEAGVIGAAQIALRSAGVAAVRSR
ncbi:MAG: ROK family protein [Candidatus Sericytochromatia bacterium]|nr:ROK family protein [Candidatus Sericytochromatia bacterium]